MNDLQQGIDQNSACGLSRDVARYFFLAKIKGQSNGNGRSWGTANRCFFRKRLPIGLPESRKPRVPQAVRRRQSTDPAKGWRLVDRGDARPGMRGESFSIRGMTIPLRGRPIVINWSYAPIYDWRDRVTGFISEGFSRLPAEDSIVARLVDWLESSQPDDALPSGLPPPPTSPENLAESRRQLARSLRLTLSPDQL
jgi:hypothetical protein